MYCSNSFKDPEIPGAMPCGGMTAGFTSQLPFLEVIAQRTNFNTPNLALIGGTGHPKHLSIDLNKASWYKSGMNL